MKNRIKLYSSAIYQKWKWNTQQSKLIRQEKTKNEQLGSRLKNNTFFYKNATSGITLLALIVTIITLLILAGVTLNLALGSNGLLDKATLASNTWANETKEETAQMDNAISFIDKTAKLLPTEYQKVEYIESLGTQYINTNKYPSESMKINMELTLTAPSENYKGIICGTWNYGGFLLEQITKGFKWHGQKVMQKSNCIEEETKYELNLSFYDFNIDSTQIVNSSNTTYTLINKNPITIFAGVVGNRSGYSKMKLYSFKIYDGDYENLIMNLVPCYNKLDNVKGLYDLIEGNFYTNQGKGDDFIAGPDI